MSFLKAHPEQGASRLLTLGELYDAFEHSLASVSGVGNCVITVMVSTGWRITPRTLVGLTLILLALLTGLLTHPVLPISYQPKQRV